MSKIRTNTGFKGVRKRSDNNKYQAYFDKNSRQKSIGCFKKLKDAVNARTIFIENLIS